MASTWMFTRHRRTSWHETLVEERTGSSNEAHRSCLQTAALSIDVVAGAVGQARPSQSHWKMRLEEGSRLEWLWGHGAVGFGRNCRRSVVGQRSFEVQIVAAWWL